jgi:hypothetical protein
VNLGDRFSPQVVDGIPKYIVPPKKNLGTSIPKLDATITNQKYLVGGFTPSEKY